MTSEQSLDSGDGETFSAETTGISGASRAEGSGKTFSATRVAAGAAFSEGRGASAEAAPAQISPSRRDTLLDLAERCERASGADRKLDRAIWYALQDEMTGDPSHGPKFTASLDAAMTLVGDAYCRLGNDGDGPDVAAYKATVTSDTGFGGLAFNDAVAATPALALTAAALRARAAMEPQP